MKSLRNYSNIQHYLNDIVQFYRHPENYAKVLVLVEGSKDEYLYKNFFDDSTTFIKAVEGSRNLEQLDKILLRDHTEIKCIIIEDSDFNNLDHYKTPIDGNTFYTEGHDLEMSCLMSTECASKFCSDIKTNIHLLSSVFEDLLLLSYYRWYNEKYGCHNDFSEVNEDIPCLTPEEIKDYSVLSTKVQTNDTRDDSGHLLRAIEIKEAVLNNFISDNASAKENSYNLCNGHDFLRRIIYYIQLGNFCNITTERRLFDTIKDNYSLANFLSTSLATNIGQWEEINGITLLKK